jgi:hypothetical protein
MSRFKARATTPDEQLAQSAERAGRDAAAADERATTAIQAADDETQRIRKLQAGLGIIRFEDQPAAVPLWRIHRALSSGLAKLDAEIDLLDIEQYLATATSKGRSNKQQLAERAAKRRAELGRGAEPVPQPAGGLPPEVQRALAVLNNDETALKGPPKSAGRMAQLQDAKVVFEAGIRAVEGQLEELRATAAYEQATRIQKRHGELLVELFRAAQRLSEKAIEEQSSRAAFTNAGHPPRWDLLPAPGVLGAILVLGREAEWESQISEYRRFLQQRGLLR